MRPSHSLTKQKFHYSTRASSVGSNTRNQSSSNIGSIITQIDEYSSPTNSLTDNFKERIRSPLPNRKIIIDNFLIPEQHPDKIGKKTLILDLDETLVHSAFEEFKCPADIELKVIKIFI
jgi:TFIIF-interacting CTD phosphatase-like protein